MRVLVGEVVDIVGSQPSCAEPGMNTRIDEKVDLIKFYHRQVLTAERSRSPRFETSKPIC